jgi:hypothetical protein
VIPGGSSRTRAGLPSRRRGRSPGRKPAAVGRGASVHRQSTMVRGNRSALRGRGIRTIRGLMCSRLSPIHPCSQRRAVGPCPVPRGRYGRTFCTLGERFCSAVADEPTYVRVRCRAGCDGPSLESAPGVAGTSKFCQPSSRLLSARRRLMDVGTRAAAIPCDIAGDQTAASALMALVDAPNANRRWNWPATTGPSLMPRSTRVQHAREVSLSAAWRRA